MLQELATSINMITILIQNNLRTLAIILFIPWFFYFFSACISKKILLLGIIPRRLFGLPGILFAPLLHANFNHIFFNSIPLVVLSCFVLVNGIHYYLCITLMISVLSGFAIWCFAKNGLYIGASALITGYWSFLVTNIYNHTNPISVLLGLISLYYFAGLLLGIIPREKGVSWLGHLFGLIAGIITSFLPYSFISFGT